MAKAIFVKVARKAIYEKGKNVQYISQTGKKEGQTLSKLDRTVPRDENDKVFVEKGDSYFWWEFKNGGKHFSKEQPKRSQLTQSNYLSQLYDLQDRISDLTADSPETLEIIVSDLLGDFENLRDETQESLDNMPESLQSSPTGELLQERIDCLDGAISELEDVDCDYEEPDEDDIKQDIADEDGIDIEEISSDFEDLDKRIKEKKDEKMQEWLDEKITEIQGISTE